MLDLEMEGRRVVTGVPVSAMTAVLRVISHHKGPGSLLSQAQWDGLITALSAFDWSEYEAPDFAFPQEDEATGWGGANG